ncbi:MAG: TolC family protein, partial [Candidatus Omnitrophica bacterium]|nr:TolC family protein [Candidatus Omnitrophota bacterium]
THETLGQRLGELRERERIGRSRGSEVASAQAFLHQTEAQIQLVQSQATAARLLLEFLTGREPLGDLQEEQPGFPSLDPEENLLLQSDQRPDVKASEEALAAADQEIRVARADRWPTVSLEGNYFVERVGASKEVDWDAAFKVDLPIFDGGETSGAVREAVSSAAQAKWRAQEAKRRASQEVQDAYEKFQLSLARSATLAEARQAAEEAARLQGEEHRLSLLSTIDFLESIERLEETRRELIRARYEAKRAYWALKAAAGEIP